MERIQIMQCHSGRKLVFLIKIIESITHIGKIPIKKEQNMEIIRLLLQF